MIPSLRGEAAVVQPGDGIFDHDLDARPRRRLRTPADPPYEYQRLVVNPLLAVLAWIVLFGLLRVVASGQEAERLATGILFFALPVLLIQFHCLDCGATGWLIRWRRHACPKVVARWQNRTIRRFHGPRLRIQLVAWFILMFAALMLGVIALGS